MNSHISMIVFLLLTWIGFSNDFSSVNLLTGLLVSIAIHFTVAAKKQEYTVNVWQLFLLILYTVKELILSSLEVAWDVITPSDRSQPDLLMIPIECKHPLQISLLSNLISLTPGTIAIEVTNDNKYILVHVMFTQNKDKIYEFIKHTLEAKIMKVIKNA